MTETKKNSASIELHQYIARSFISFAIYDIIISHNNYEIVH